MGWFGKLIGGCKHERFTVILPPQDGSVIQFAQIPLAATLKIIAQADHGVEQLSCSDCGTILSLSYFDNQKGAPAPAPPKAAVIQREEPTPAPPPPRGEPAAAPADDGMVRFPCLKCGKRLKAPPAARGKAGKCSKCQTRFVVPTADAGAAGADGSGANGPPAAAAGGPGYTRRPNPAEWAGVFGELAAQDNRGDARPQLWLLCQTPPMAVTLLTSHPAPAAALVAGVPELAEFSDGRAAVIFPIRNGRDALALLRALFAGSYGADTPVVLGGAAAGAPPADIEQILAMFGRGEALMIGSVAVW